MQKPANTCLFIFLFVFDIGIFQKNDKEEFGIQTVSCSETV